MKKKELRSFEDFDDLEGPELRFFNQIVESIYQKRGVDFREYRPRSLRRRILVAMHDHHVYTFREYMRILNETPEEYDNLLNRITINVSEFFRNQATFRAVEEQVLPLLLDGKKKSGNSILRIWSAGCATGEEPYSIAIMFKEFFKKNSENMKVTIFATDIDNEAIEKAKTAIYPKKALVNLKNFPIDDYFELHEDEAYVVKPEIRDMVKFKHHNMISDVPLKRIDMVFCRNVLIYFNRQLQRKVYINFHQALAQKGFLVAGKVETLMNMGEDMFDRVDQAERIFQKKQHGANFEVN